MAARFARLFPAPVECRDERRPLPPAELPQRPAAPGRGRAAGPPTGPRRRRLGQDPRAGAPDRLADPGRARLALQHPVGDLHQQGGGGDAPPHRAVARDQSGGHVGRHLPRPRPSPAARALARGRAERELPDPRQRRPATPGQAGDPRTRPRRAALAGAPGPVVHQRAEGRGPAAATHPARRRPVPRHHAEDLRSLRGGLRPRRGDRLLRAAAARPGPLARPSRRARALPAALPPYPGGRVPGHQRRAVRLATDSRQGRRQPDGGRRRRPVDLRLAWRTDREHPAVQRRLRRRRGDPPGAELPFHRVDPQGRQRPDRQQPGTPGQGVVDRRRGRRVAEPVRRVQRA